MLPYSFKYDFHGIFALRGKSCSNLEVCPANVDTCGHIGRKSNKVSRRQVLKQACLTQIPGLILPEATLGLR